MKYDEETFFKKKFVLSKANCKSIPVRKRFEIFLTKKSNFKLKKNQQYRKKCVSLCTCMSFFLSVCLSFSLSVCVSVCQPIYLYACIVCLNFGLSVSFSLSVWTPCLCVCVSVCMSACLFVCVHCVSPCLSVCLSVRNVL
jgi:hypothetical protein